MNYNAFRQRFSKLKIIFLKKNNFQFTKPMHENDCIQKAPPQYFS